MTLYSPAYPNAWTQIVLGTMSIQSVGYGAQECNAGTVGGAAWPAANLVIYTPFWVAEPTTVTKVWWNVVAVAGNIDLGIYDSAGTLLASAGTTVVAGANTLQTVDITDITLARGNYYFGMVADTVTTLSLGRVAPAAGICQALGLLEQTSVTLPLATNASPATFAKYTRAYIPDCGLLGFRTAL
jgi:hypothetical protein